MIRIPVISVACFAMVANNPAGAQKPPAVRQIGRLERVSTYSLASVATAIPMPDGRVLVNDQTGRRILLFDSSLTRITVVADTTDATAQTYGPRQGALVRYRADSTLFIDPGSLSMFVISPVGRVVRVMAIPRPNDVYALSGASFDPRGKLVYVNDVAQMAGIIMLSRSDPVARYRPPYPPESLVQPVQHIDSTFIIRVDLTTRIPDTIGTVRIAKMNRELRGDTQGMVSAIELTPDPLPVVDDWAMLLDGSIGVVRGRDYHIDWRDPSGRWSSTPTMPFDWQRVTDARKEALIDSAVTSWQATFAQFASGRGRSGQGRGGSDAAPNVAVRPRLSDVADYFPPFTRGSVRADVEGNLWICTTTMVGGQPVYDIVNRRGELFDRVQLPSFRTIAGFGPGVIYMAMKDSAGVVHLERARVK